MKNGFVMLRTIVAVAIFGAAWSTFAVAQAPYDNDLITRMKYEADRLRSPATPGAPAVDETAPDDRQQTDAYPKQADTYPKQPAGYPTKCENCPPPRHYDNVEVVKTSKDVDQSRVINTESVVHVPPRTKEINKLIVRENETRNVGVVQHNHTIIEKEIRYVKRRAPAYRAPAYHVPVTYQGVCRNGVLAYWIVRRGYEATVVPPESLGSRDPCHRPCGCGEPAEAYVPQYDHRYGYRYDTGSSPRTVYVPVQAYGAYR